jgi:thioredoxin-related protein
MHRISIAILLALLFSLAWAYGYEEEEPDLPIVSIPEVSSFAAESKLADSQDRIIMLLVSQVHCPYCVLIKKEIIHPMIRGGDHADKLLIRELFIDRGGKIEGFDGKFINSMEFAKQHGASFTPTLLFLDSKGNELTERMIGINTPEMYFYYVDQAIRKALLAMKS